MAVTFRGRAGVGVAVAVCVGAILFAGILDSLAPTTRAMVFAVAGVTILGIALPVQLRTRALLKHGVQAQGTVVDAVEESGRGHNNIRSTTYHPVVRFTTADGRTVTFTSGLGFGRQQRIGGPVPVRYRGDAPDQAEIDRAYIWMLPAAPPLLIGVGLLVAAALAAFTGEPQGAPAAEEPLVAPPVVDSPDNAGTGEPVAVGPPPAKVATGRIGDTLTAVDATGKGQLQLTVTRLRFSTGAQGDPPPEHGVYVAMHVRARALADGQLLRIKALVDGRPYDQYTDVSSAAFQPLLANVNFSLDEGDVAAGWVVFDVPRPARPAGAAQRRLAQGCGLDLLSCSGVVTTAGDRGQPA